MDHIYAMNVLIMCVSDLSQFEAIMSTTPAGDNKLCTWDSEVSGVYF